MSEFPKNLKYNKDYSWLKIEGDQAVMGVISLGVKQIDEFVFVMLPFKGKGIKKGETYVNLEAVKWSGNLTSPLTGEVKEINQDVFNNPNKINEAPYDNWLIKMTIKDSTELAELMDYQAAEKFYQTKK